MRRLALIAFVAALLAPATSSAAGWTGTVVAKDPGRRAAVTASADGTVRTVRVGAGLARLAVGQRVAVVAAQRADGTFAATRTRTLGRSVRTKLHAVVVAVDRARSRVVVSAGGSVFAIARADLRGSRSGPRAGDVVTATIALTRGQAAATGLATTGRAQLVELEGILTGSADGTLQLAVVRRGLVAVGVPAGVTLPALTVGDEIELLASVASDGSFTLVALDGEDGDDHGLDEDEREVELEGELVSLAPLTVTAGARTLTCAVPAGLSLAGFAVGASVEMECRQTASGLVLAKLRTEDEDEDDEDEGEDEGDDDEGEDDEDEGNGREVELEGELVSLAPLTVTAGGRSLTCAVPEGVSLAGFAVGMRVELECSETAAGVVLKKLEADEDEDDLDDDEDEGDDAEDDEDDAEDDE